METNSNGKIACATIIHTLVVLDRRIHDSPLSQLGIRSILAPENNISQLAANESFNQCNEQTRLLKHEIALCRAVPLITVPLQ
jgi:hypothetical protein